MVKSVHQMLYELELGLEEIEAVLDRLNRLYPPNTIVEYKSSFKYTYDSNVIFQHLSIRPKRLMILV